MGAAASFGADDPAGYTLSDEEVDSIFQQVSSAITPPEGGNITKEQMIAQMMERKFNLVQGSFRDYVSGKVPGSPRPPAAEGGADDELADLPSDGAEGSPAPAPAPAPVEQRVSAIQSRMSQLELTKAMSEAGIIHDGNEDQHAVLIEKLFKEIDGIMQNKKPEIVVEEETKLDWKALELLGDEKLITEEKERGVIDVTHDGSAPDGGHKSGSKALKLAGETKAVANKKIRDRLGSDMSHDQMKRQQMQAAAEKKKSEMKEQNTASNTAGKLLGKLVG
ncbi:hypothetical protein TeGR_g5813 [Tetraparma gracilis]|uniref:Uncharacterized protein n=1 Tax=Tetraparma gracilis TaxID=2962635 RepID=A0ABQ6N9S2_9STRA|nr:hypothetical protein TeGR_g5813 [Tetraparma gracilis]